MHLKLAIALTVAFSSQALLPSLAGAELVSRMLVVADSLEAGQKLDSAIVVASDALKIAQWQYGRMDTTVALAHEQLAHYYYELIPKDTDRTRLTAIWKKNNSQSEKHCLDALTIWSAIGGPYNPYLSPVLDQLAKVYDAEQRTEEANKARSRAQSIRQLFYGWDDVRNARDLMDSASELRDSGEYAAAEKILDTVKAKLSLIYGSNHIRTVAVDLIYNPGWLEFYKANRDSLESLYNEQERADSLHKSSIDNASLGRLATAERDCIDALELYRRNLGDECLDVAWSLRQLGRIYWARQKLDEADSVFARSSEVLEQVLGGYNPDLGENFIMHAGLLLSQGQYQKAELLCYRALGIESINHPARKEKVAIILDYLASCSRHQDRPDTALHLSVQAAKLRLQIFESGAATLPERDALLFSARIRRSLDEVLSTYRDLKIAEVKETRETADIVLSTKGIVSDVMIRRRRALIFEQEPAVQALMDSLRYSHYYLSQLFVSSLRYENPALYSERSDSLSLVANDLEARLARQSTISHKLQGEHNISAVEVASSLPSGSVLVDYVRYDYLQLSSDSVVPHYVALIIKSRREPMIVDLGASSAIDTLIEQYREHLLGLSKGQIASISVLDEEYVRISSLLYEKLWRPVRARVGSAELVFIAPDGGLNLVSFAGLSDRTGSYIIEGHAIQYLLSGREILHLDDRNQAGSGLLALGDPDFDAPPQTRLMGRKEELQTFEPEGGNPQAARNVRAGCDELRDLRVMPVPGTRREVEMIAAGWSRVRGEPSELLLGSMASEENFKAAAHGKRIIHLATHGYFLEEPCQSTAVVLDGPFESGSPIENPLLLSGLLLAGSNLHGEGADTMEVEDGILTAEEIASMEFTGISLVVLSACETGLGTIRKGEGVYGLRRAFLLAGARTVISSLWPVSDRSTSEMMEYFYSHPSKDLPSTFRSYALQQIQKGRTAGFPVHPYLWAPFVIIGDQRNP